jgi:hypothetical protein
MPFSVTFAKRVTFGTEFQSHTIMSSFINSLEKISDIPSSTISIASSPNILFQSLLLTTITESLEIYFNVYDTVFLFVVFALNNENSLPKSYKVLYTIL